LFLFNIKKNIKELAFVYNSLRKATVTSLTSMELISIGKEDYIDIFMSNKSEEPEHVKFLETIPFTKGWPLEKLKQFPSSCAVHYYKLVFNINYFI
jgi:hypothetical protein